MTVERPNIPSLPQWGWADTYRPSVQIVGDTRVDTGNPDPDYRPRPVGFTAQLEDPKPVVEPDDLDAWAADRVQTGQWVPCRNAPRLGVEDYDEHAMRDAQASKAEPATRCGECGDTDGRHFRCCPHHDPRDRA